MSPEYVIRVSKEEDPWFKNIAAEGRIQILSERLTPEENKAQARFLWNEQTPITRELIAEFKRDHDPETEKRITSGILSLIVDIFPNNDPHDFRTLDEVEIPALKGALVSFFESSVPEDLPEDVFYLSAPKPFLTKRGDGVNRLLPLHVSIILEKYGLVDGQPKPAASICRKYNLSISALTQIISLKCPIRYDNQIRWVVLKTPKLRKMWG